MNSEPKDQNVAVIKPRLEDLEQTIRVLASDTGKISWSKHATERMVERSIFNGDAIRVLRNGMIEDDIEPGDSPGEWKCKMVGQIKGSRDLGVVTIVVNNQRLFVKTVEWEDLR